MIAPMLILALACITATHAMLAVQQDSHAIVCKLQGKADSLRQKWDIQWKQSDSLRVEAMFLRIRSDSIRRVLKAFQSAVPALSKEITLDSLILERVRAGRVKSGQTLSDSITLETMRTSPDTGVASFYAEAFHGKKTSSGETYNMNDRTCAHRWLPYNTLLRVTNLANGKSVEVRVTDRGPWKHTRIIDVSKQAAIDLDMIRTGTTRVYLEVIPDPAPD